MRTCDLLTCFEDNRQQLPASPQTGSGPGSLAALEQLPCLQALALTLQLRNSSHQEQRELAAALVRLTVRQGFGFPSAQLMDVLPGSVLLTER